jgi:hypothetical protein
LRNLDSTKELEIDSLAFVKYELLMAKFSENGSIFSNHLLALAWLKEDETLFSTAENIKGSEASSLNEVSDKAVLLKEREYSLEIKWDSSEFRLLTRLRLMVSPAAKINKSLFARSVIAGAGHADAVESKSKLFFSENKRLAMFSCSGVVHSLLVENAGKRCATEILFDICLLGISLSNAPLWDCIVEKPTILPQKFIILIHITRSAKYIFNNKIKVDDTR